MTIEYAIRCDGCGRLIATSRSSARAARAEAQLERGANHGPDGDRCEACRKKQIAELNRQARDRGPAMTHSIGVGLPKFGPS